MQDLRYYILCVRPKGGGGTLKVSRKLVKHFGDHFTIEKANDFPSGLERVRSLGRIGRKISLIVAVEAVGTDELVDFIKETNQIESLTRIPIVIVKGSHSSRDYLSENGNLSKEIQVVPESNPKLFVDTCRKLLTDFFAMRETPDLVKVARVLDVQRLSEDFLEIEKERNTFKTELHDIKTGLQVTSPKTDKEIIGELLEGIGRILNVSDYTRSYKKGETILVEGRENNNLMIITRGRVRLSKRIDGEEVDLSEFVTGKIIGVLSFVEANPVFASAVAVTDCELLVLTNKDIQFFFEADASLSSLIFSKITRSMAERIRLHVNLQMKIRDLNKAVAKERDELQNTLASLDRTRMKLFESEKMAVLGQFVSGIAHELNNPAGALLRGSAQLAETVFELTKHFSRLPDSQIRKFYDFGAVILSSSINSSPKSLREIRGLTKSMEKRFAKLSSPHEHARMLSEIHFEDFDQVTEFITSNPEPERAIEVLHCFHQIGQGLRHIRVSSERIEGIVGSLRSYARPDTEEDVKYDVNRGINDTMLILGHHFKTIKVARNYSDLPYILGNPGALNQVWTNLLINSVEAMNGKGKLVVTTRVSGKYIVVEIEDDGPGIPPEIMKRIWDLNFTTKTGSNNFGLGLGLAITRSIVEGHKGIVDVVSEPGTTKFTVKLLITEIAESDNKD